MFDFLKLGSKKSGDAPKVRKGGGYFLELDESKAAPSGNGKQAEAPQVEAPQAEAPQAEAPQVEAHQAEPDQVTESKGKRSKAKASNAKSAPAEAPQAEPAPAPVVAPAPVAVQKPADPTFAPNHLLTLSSTNGRRRPGANMNSFLDMASQVKKR